jgi:putative RecB family exonuclease
MTPSPPSLKETTLSQQDQAQPGLVPLSPSRASDYKTCPQLFKFRAIDRLPEPADIYSTKGTLVHAVLERLYLLDPEIGRAHV